MVKKYPSRSKGQVALDFMLSYGMAILIITLSLYVIFRVGLFNTKLAPLTCTSSASAFICEAASLTTSGNLTIVLAQNTNGPINITAAACSTLQNSSTNGPAYGNINLVPYLSSNSFYPNNALIHGLTIASDSAGRLSVYCYSSPSSPASSTLGSQFAGIVWINYTNVGLPLKTHTVQVVAEFNTRYT
jgi:uncharacterized protein (UPF0333 family)